MSSIKYQATEPLLGGLDLDVLAEIFHFVHDSSRADIFSLICVNKPFHEAALPFTVRECALCFDELRVPISHARIACWLRAGSQDAWVLTKIQVFTVFGTGDIDSYHNEAKYEADRQTKWTPILHLIPFLPNLKAFTFALAGDRIPASLLQGLEKKRPEITLSMKHWGLGRYRNLRNLTISIDEAALVLSPLLRSLEMDHCQILRLGHIHGMLRFSYVVLKWILVHSDHLTSLILKAPSRPPERPWVGFPKAPPRPAGLSSSNSERPPFLATGVFTIPSILPKHKIQCLRMLPCSETFADFCIQVSEPSCLTDLRCMFPLPQLSNPHIVCQLTALRSLELRVGCLTSGTETLTLLEDLLTSSPPLRRLSLSSPDSLRSMLAIITTHHGHSLQNFSLLQTESSRYDAFSPMSLNDITHLKQTCTCLQKLALTTNLGYPLSDAIEGVRQFTSLSNLTLVFPENPYIMERPGEVMLPWVSRPGNATTDWEAAAKSQSRLRPSFAASILEDIVSKGCPLTKLTLKLGDLAASTTAKEFIVSRSWDGKVTVKVKG